PPCRPGADRKRRIPAPPASGAPGWPRSRPRSSGPPRTSPPSPSSSPCGHPVAGPAAPSPRPPGIWIATATSHLTRLTCTAEDHSARTPTCRVAHPFAILQTEKHVSQVATPPLVNQHVNDTVLLFGPGKIGIVGFPPLNRRTEVSDDVGLLVAAAAT